MRHFNLNPKTGEIVGIAELDGIVENERTISDFRSGKLDVLVNVKMLTEGVDVPDVRTVMITRQTTSSILLTQRIPFFPSAAKNLPQSSTKSSPKKSTMNTI